MPISIREGKLLYHITSINNLKGILNSGLKARAQVSPIFDVASVDVLTGRKIRELDNFVPFHFFANTPFAGSIQKEYPKENFLYITIKRTFAREHDFKIIPRHPLSQDPRLFDYDDGIKEIQWEIMNKRDYSDNNSKEICMAECLSPQKINPENIFAIYVKNDLIKQNVLEIINNFSEFSSLLKVDICTGMFVK